MTLTHYMSDIFGRWCGLNIHGCAGKLELLPSHPKRAMSALWGMVW